MALLLLAVAAALAVSALLGTAFWRHGLPHTTEGMLVLAVVLIGLWLPACDLALTVAREQPFALSMTAVFPKHLPVGYFFKRKRCLPFEEISRIRVDSSDGELFAKISSVDGVLIEIQESDGIPREAFLRLRELQRTLVGATRNHQ